MYCLTLLWLMWKRWHKVKLELVDIQKVQEIVQGQFIIKSGFLVNLEEPKNVLRLIVNVKKEVYVKAVYSCINFYIDLL